MKVTIEFDINKKYELEFAKLIQSMSKKLKKIGVNWTYKVETSLEEYKKIREIKFYKA